MATGLVIGRFDESRDLTEPGACDQGRLAALLAVGDLDSRRRHTGNSRQSRQLVGDKSRSGCRDQHVSAQDEAVVGMAVVFRASAAAFVARVFAGWLSTKTHKGIEVNLRAEHIWGCSKPMHVGMQPLLVQILPIGVGYKSPAYIVDHERSHKLRELPAFEGKLAAGGIGVRNTEPIREGGQRLIV